MTEMYLKELLSSWKRRQVQLELWKNQLLIGNNIVIKEYDKYLLQVKIVKSAMEILTNEARFIVETHLINHKTWNETG